MSYVKCVSMKLFLFALDFNLYDVENSFYTSCKYEKIRCFLMFSEGIERPLLVNLWNQSISQRFLANQILREKSNFFAVYIFIDVSINISLCINTLMSNVTKWSDTLEKSCGECSKTFKVCLTILGRLFIKGLKLIVAIFYYMEKYFIISKALACLVFTFYLIAQTHEALFLVCLLS